jgi:hypothetical protein
MNRTRKIVAGLTLTAAATFAPLSAQAQPALPTPPVSTQANQPCAKWVGDWNISGRNGVSVRDNVGATHVIKKGYPQWFCPVSAYVHVGYDTYASSGAYHSNYTSTGWHTLSGGLKLVASGDLHVYER